RARKGAPAALALADRVRHNGSAWGMGGRGDVCADRADPTLATDRGDKGSLYASAGVPGYWVINLVDNVVEVYRNPVPDPSQRFGHRYATRTDHHAGDQVAPLALPGVTVPVAELLP